MTTLSSLKIWGRFVHPTPRLRGYSGGTVKSKICLIDNNLAVRRPVTLKIHELILGGSTEAAELSKYTSGQIQDGGRRPNF